MRHGLMLIVGTASILALMCTRHASACGGYGSSLELMALNGDAENSNQAIAALRAMGQPGLDRLLAAAARYSPSPEQTRRATDAVAAQLDAQRSKLFWHTDLSAAVETAQRENKPILTLRLLGKLDEELSCANSRFFRAVLYPNAQVSDYLRRHYVLHWQSVRPAPVITIDFGDGRTLKRTITGNSIHYVLDRQGRVIDAIPGLVSAPVFLELLRNAEQLAAQTASESDPSSFIRNYHVEQANAERALWAADLKRLKALAPDADVTPLNLASLEKLTEQDSVGWTRLAEIHAAEWRLDPSTRQVVRSMAPSAYAAGRIAVGKAVVEDPMLRIVGRFERSLAEDTVRNRYFVRGQLHEWFLGGRILSLEALNRQVYAELFKMPATDPWLGLMTDFDAIERSPAPLAQLAVPSQN